LHNFGEKKKEGRLSENPSNSNIAMATKRTPPKPAEPPSVTPEQGINLINRQIEAGVKLGEWLDIPQDQYGAWINTTENYLVKAFGSGSPNITRFHDVGRMFSYPTNAPDSWWEQYRRETLHSKIVHLRSYIELLKTEMELTHPQNAKVLTVVSHTALSRKVFLVHGHHEGARETCARFLEKLELQPIILHEQPNKGRTIIEKFTDYSDVGFAVVLLTADDKGGTKNSSEADLQPRARQNVILELGFFLGKLGRARVCALYGSEVELPSDYSGVLFVPLDNNGEWRFKLCREIKAAGIEIDANKAL
jgi:predicted nucleotide-binding protein